MPRAQGLRRKTLAVDVGRNRAEASVEIAGETIALAVTWHPRARRFTLRVDPRTGGARLSVPSHADLDDAIAFLKRHESWLVRERDKIAAPVPFCDGCVIPLRGAPHVIRQKPVPGRKITLGDDCGAPAIWIAGAADMMAIRLTRWLKAEARREINSCVVRHAARLGTSPGHIVLRDQRSRWGSCSSSGSLSFSWRLILAPDSVLDYVAAHEVAHLLEMNHGPGFWKLVDDTGVDVALARQWLARNGQGLHRYGQTDA